MKIVITESQYKKILDFSQTFFDEELIEYKKLSEEGELHYSADYTVNSIKRIISSNIERLNNEWITGEADIVTDTSIIDIKTSWSLDTFPKIPEKAYDALYEWQVRSYMWLYNKQYAQVIFCMIDTPDYLLNQWAVLELHKVSHIAPEKRITTLLFTRDLELEEEIKVRLHHCTEYYVKYINQLSNK